MQTQSIFSNSFVLHPSQSYGTLFTALVGIKYMKTFPTTSLFNAQVSGRATIGVLQRRSGSKN